MICSKPEAEGGPKLSGSPSGTLTWSFTHVSVQEVANKCAEMEGGEILYDSTLAIPQV